MKMFHLILLISCFYLGRALDCGGNQISNTIVVDQQGKGSFVTVQAAIDSIKNQNENWVMIKINPGIYKEKVIIPSEKPCIILKGSGSNTTTITYYDSFHNKGTSLSATFISSPPNIVVSGITFKNTFGTDGPAVAANFYGDKSAIFDSSFMGYQDTLLISLGRSYFKNCYIEGEVDFIFGSGQTYFENSLINATQGHKRPPGYVTAHRRNSANDPNGFVFRGGSLVGTGKVHLGRPWGVYARVIFWETYFSSVVAPRGWNIWDLKHGQELNVVFAEVNCTGPGSNTKNRVRWEKKPSYLNMNDYTLSSFVNYDGWLDQIPSIM